MLDCGAIDVKPGNLSPTQALANHVLAPVV
jgi:hypothetical protein